MTRPEPPRIAFHAPMKPPDHPNPSGDRRIARLTLDALRAAGFAPELASTLRTLDLHGDPARQSALTAEADAEAARLIARYRPDPPAAWLSYHCYWKAPDLIGPRVAAALDLPYVVTEPIHSPKRREGPWSAFAEAAEDALAAADLLLWSTPRDLPQLAARFPADRLAELPPFLDPGPEPPARTPAGPLRLIAVAMMRPGDKLASYRALAAGLAAAPGLDATLAVVGDGAARAEVHALLPNARFTGALDAAPLRAELEAADLLVWPGVGEGFGMVYLEAQAAGLPCLAEDRPGPRHVLAPGALIVPPDDPPSLAAALHRAAADRPALAQAGAQARAHVLARHSLSAAAETLGAHLRRLIAARAR